MTSLTNTRPVVRFLLVLLLALPALPAKAQPVGEKSRLAVRTIEASRPVLDAARFDGQSRALEQILAAADAQLITAIANTRRFDIVARSDIATVMREQDLADAGLLDPEDPQAARAYAMAGARYVATVRIDNFQDAVAEADFQGGLGRTTMERRTVQLLATLRIYDTTTAVLLDTVSLRLEESEVRETLPGARHEGRLTNSLLGAVAERFARDASNAIMDRLAPARVLAYTAGLITLNRGEGTGVFPGQYWRVYHAGQALVDPDTGEVLGVEEIPVGWARITEVLPRFSRAEAIEDTGIDAGSILRHARDGLPADVNPAGRATGSARTSPAGRTPATRTDDRSTGTSGSDRYAPAEPTDRNAVAGADPMRVAIFVRNTSPDFPDRYTDALESWVTSGVGGPGVEVISRALVLNAVGELSDDGANRGTDERDADRASRLLSDQASALSLARTLGADALLVATAVDLTESSRRFRDEDLGIDTDITDATLSITWDLISGDTGGTIDGGWAEGSGRVRGGGRTESSPTELGTLVRDAATRAAGQARRAMLDNAGRSRAETPAEVSIEVRVTMEDLSVPEIRLVDGAWVVTAERYLLQPSSADIIVDGFVAGSAPGTVSVAPGPRRLRIERPGMEPVDRFVVARDGMTLTVPMRLSEDGRRRWMEHARFIESLKDGDALRENERVLAAALAEFLAESRLVIDTSALESLTVTPGVVSYWADLFQR